MYNAIGVIVDQLTRRNYPNEVASTKSLKIIIDCNVSRCDTGSGYIKSDTHREVDVD